MNKALQAKIEAKVLDQVTGLVKQQLDEFLKDMDKLYLKHEGATPFKYSFSIKTDIWPAGESAEADSSISWSTKKKVDTGKEKVDLQPDLGLKDTKGKKGDKKPRQAKK